MAVMYRKYQNKIKKSTTYGKWYARAVTVNTMTTNELAEKIEANCSMRQSDVLAVLRELASTVRDALKDSKRVNLDGLGYFKPVISTVPAATSDEFNSHDNVKRVNVVFKPEITIDNSGQRTIKLIQGYRVSELPKNSVTETKVPASGNIPEGE